MNKSSPHQPEVSIVVVTFCSADDIEEALMPLKDPVEAQEFEVIVVDNASSDDTCEVLTEFEPWAQVIALDANIGYGRACNIGWRRARAPYVLFLNPDARISSEDILKLSSFLDSNKEVGLCAPVILGSRGTAHKVGGMPALPQDFSRLGWGYTDTRLMPEPAQTDVQVDWLSGAIQLIRKTTLQQLSGFDERFFLYFEETDLAYRAQQFGWQLWVVGDANAFHLGAQSAKRTNAPLVSGAIANHFFASRFYYYGKNFSWAQAFLFEFLDKALSIARVAWRKLQKSSTEAPMIRLHNPIAKLPAAHKIQWRAKNNIEHVPQARRADLGDVENLVQLFQDAFMKWPDFEISGSPENFLRWKLQTVEGPIGWVMQANDKIVASSLRIRMPVYEDGKRTIATQGVDTAVASTYQRRGIYHKMEATKDKDLVTNDVSGATVRLGLSSNPSILRRREKLGRRSIPILEYEHVLDASAVAIRNKLAYNALLPLWAQRLRSRLGRRTVSIQEEVCGEIEFRKVHRFDSCTDGIFSAYQDYFYFTVEKTHEYLNWRYIDAPRRYVAVGAFSGSELLGFVVYVQDADIVSIADIVAPLDDLNISNHLISYVLKTAVKNGAIVVKLWSTPNHPMVSVVVELGFSTCNELAATIRRADLSRETIEPVHVDEAKINFVMGDSDWI